MQPFKTYMYSHYSDKKWQIAIYICKYIMLSWNAFMKTTHKRILKPINHFWSLCQDLQNLNFSSKSSNCSIVLFSSNMPIRFSWTSKAFLPSKLCIQHWTTSLGESRKCFSMFRKKKSTFAQNDQNLRCQSDKMPKKTLTCVTLVRSKQSTQLVLTTPFCTSCFVSFGSFRKYLSGWRENLFTIRTTT